MSTAGRHVDGDASAAGARVVLCTLVVGVVVLQRLAVPLGATPLPLVLVLGYAAVGALLVLGALQVDRVRLELYALAGGACAVVGVGSVVGRQAGTLTSLGLLLVLYLPWVLRVRPWLGGLLGSVSSTFVRLMLVLSVVGVAQLAGQLTGAWEHSDPIRDVLPRELLLPGFNTVNPLAYDSPVVKPTAFVFLEPSFLSQYCALAALLAILARRPAWQVLVLVAGMASAVSGTGILLLVVGGALTLVRAPQRLRASYLVAAAGAVAVVLLSPVAGTLLSRTGEVSQQGTSGSLRFVQPWTEVARGLDSDVLRYLVGAGPGTAERLLTSLRGGSVGGEAVVYTVVPKLLFEYGLIAGGLFVIFLVIGLLDRTPWRVVPGSVLVMVFVLSGSLLQPHTIFLAWLFTSVWAGSGPADDDVPSTTYPVAAAAQTPP